MTVSDPTKSWENTEPDPDSSHSPARTGSRSAPNPATAHPDAKLLKAVIRQLGACGSVCMRSLCFSAAALTSSGRYSGASGGVQSNSHSRFDTVLHPRRVDAEQKAVEIAVTHGSRQ